MQKVRLLIKQIKVSMSCATPLTIFSSVTEKNKSYVVSSFVETKGETMIAKTAVEFVEYPLRCYSKIINHVKWSD